MPASISPNPKRIPMKNKISFEINDFSFSLKIITKVTMSAVPRKIYGGIEILSIDFMFK